MTDFFPSVLSSSPPFHVIFLPCYLPFQYFLQIQNTTFQPIHMEKVTLEASSLYDASELNDCDAICDERTRRRSRNMNYLDTRQYLYRLTPKPVSGILVGLDIGPGLSNGIYDYHFSFWAGCLGACMTWISHNISSLLTTGRRKRQFARSDLHREIGHCLEDEYGRKGTITNVAASAYGSR